jgi:general secretion pathway protein G
MNSGQTRWPKAGGRIQSRFVSSLNYAMRLTHIFSLQKSRGFTLIELMVVVLILGVLAAVIVPNVIGSADVAKAGAAKQDVAALMQALKLYRLDNGRYPSSDQGLGALSAKPTTEPIPNNYKTGGYIERLPKDPWGNAYIFANPGVHGEIDVMSYGADGKPGGEGPAADVHNGNL